MTCVAAVLDAQRDLLGAARRADDVQAEALAHWQAMLPTPPAAA